MVEQQWQVDLSWKWWQSKWKYC